MCYPLKGEFSQRMSIDDNSNAREVGPNKSSSTKKSRKLQLWMNQSKTKYAISFENELHYLATTDPRLPRYTTLIAESDRIFKGYEYNWRSILNKWIDHKSAIGFKKRSKFLSTSMTSYEDGSKIKNTLSNHHSTLQPWMAKNIQ